MSAPGGGPALRAEAIAGARYLTGEDPTGYVLACYERSHAAAAAGDDPPVVLVDAALDSLVRLGAFPARIADGYARWFRPFGPLRRRLILLLAILENSPPTDQPLNSAREGSAVAVAGGMAVALLGSGVCLVLGVVLLGPLHLVALLRSRPR